MLKVHITKITKRYAVYLFIIQYSLYNIHYTATNRILDRSNLNTKCFPQNKKGNVIFQKVVMDFSFKNIIADDMKLPATSA